jgi:hypothetical protein
MPDYSALRTMATRLITDAGRSLSVVTSSTTPGDATKPWRGTNGTETTTAAVGAVVEYESKEIDGEQVRIGDKLAIVAPVTGVDLSLANFIVDDSIRYRVVSCKTVKPGGIVVLYMFQVRR